MVNVHKYCFVTFIFSFRIFTDDIGVEIQLHKKKQKRASKGSIRQKLAQQTEDGIEHTIDF